MHVTLTIDQALEEALRRLGARHGISLEEAGRRALAAGLVALGPKVDLTGVEILGSVQPTRSTDGTVHLPSPHIVAGSRPPCVLRELDPDTHLGDGDAL
jgi:hypothetical protein